MAHYLNEEALAKSLLNLQMISLKLFRVSYKLVVRTDLTFVYVVPQTENLLKISAIDLCNGF